MDSNHTLTQSEDIEKLIEQYFSQCNQTPSITLSTLRNVLNQSPYQSILHFLISYQGNLINRFSYIQHFVQTNEFLLNSNINNNTNTLTIDTISILLLSLSHYFHSIQFFIPTVEENVPIQLSHEQLNNTMIIFQEPVLLIKLFFSTIQSININIFYDYNSSQFTILIESLITLIQNQFIQNTPKLFLLRQIFLSLSTFDLSLSSTMQSLFDIIGRQILPHLLSEISPLLLGFLHPFLKVTTPHHHNLMTVQQLQTTTLASSTSTSTLTTTESTISSPPPTITYIAFGIIYNHKTNQICLTLRQSMKSNGNKWEYPGGKFDPNYDSNLQDTLVRELYEEVNIIPIDFGLLCAEQYILPNNSILSFSVYFINEYYGIPTPKEGQLMCWFQPIDLLFLQFPLINYWLNEYFILPYLLLLPIKDRLYEHTNPFLFNFDQTFSCQILNTDFNINTAHQQPLLQLPKFKVKNRCLPSSDPHELKSYRRPLASFKRDQSINKIHSMLAAQYEIVELLARPNVSIINQKGCITTQQDPQQSSTPPIATTSAIATVETATTTETTTTETTIQSQPFIPPFLSNVPSTITKLPTDIIAFKLEGTYLDYIISHVITISILFCRRKILQYDSKEHYHDLWIIMDALLNQLPLTLPSAERHYRINVIIATFIGFNRNHLPHLPELTLSPATSTSSTTSLTTSNTPQSTVDSAIDSIQSFCSKSDSGHHSIQPIILTSLLQLLLEYIPSTMIIKSSIIYPSLLSTAPKISLSSTTTRGSGLTDTKKQSLLPAQQPTQTVQSLSYLLHWICDQNCSYCSRSCIHCISSSPTNNRNATIRIRASVHMYLIYTLLFTISNNQFNIFSLPLSSPTTPSSTITTISNKSTPFYLPFDLVCATPNMTLKSQRSLIHTMINIYDHLNWSEHLANIFNSFTYGLFYSTDTTHQQISSSSTISKPIQQIPLANHDITLFHHIIYNPGVDLDFDLIQCMINNGANIDVAIHPNFGHFPISTSFLQRIITISSTNFLYYSIKTSNSDTNINQRVNTTLTTSLVHHSKNEDQQGEEEEEDDASKTTNSISHFNSSYFITSTNMVCFTLLRNIIDIYLRFYPTSHLHTILTTTDHYGIYLFQQLLMMENVNPSDIFDIIFRILNYYHQHHNSSPSFHLFEPIVHLEHMKSLLAVSPVTLVTKQHHQQEEQEQHQQSKFQFQVNFAPLKFPIIQAFMRCPSANALTLFHDSLFNTEINQSLLWLPEIFSLFNLDLVTIYFFTIQSSHNLCLQYNQLSQQQPLNIINSNDFLQLEQSQSQSTMGQLTIVSQLSPLLQLETVFNKSLYQIQHKPTVRMIPKLDDSFVQSWLMLYSQFNPNTIEATRFYINTTICQSMQVPDSKDIIGQTLALHTLSLRQTSIALECYLDTIINSFE